MWWVAVLRRGNFNQKKYVISWKQSLNKSIFNQTSHSGNGAKEGFGIVGPAGNTSCQLVTPCGIQQAPSAAQDAELKTELLVRKEPQNQKLPLSWQLNDIQFIIPPKTFRWFFFSVSEIYIFLYNFYYNLYYNIFLWWWGRGYQTFIQTTLMYSFIV